MIVPRLLLLAVALISSVVLAWTTPSARSITRSDLFKVATATSLATILIAQEPAVAAETLPNGVSYEVVKKGPGPQPDRGELVAIRFAAYCGDTKIDDIFDTPEPYYTRIGSGGLIKGVEEALPFMQLGDRWKLTIPVRCRSFIARLCTTICSHRLFF